MLNSNEIDYELKSKYISFIKGEAFKHFKNNLDNEKKDLIENLKSCKDVNELFEIKGKLITIDEILYFFDDIIKYKPSKNDYSIYDSNNYDLESGSINELT